MNLEDYAFNEDDRWYVNPQVSLDEQNAFINNYRGIEAGNNSEIESQTRGLGTQIPSQLGNLTGGSGYFKSRYQTTQTNQAIADLRAAAQASALQTVLQNEIAKKQKEYKDAYRAANERSSNKNNNNNDDEPLYKTLESKLKIKVEPSVSEEEHDLSEDKETQPGELGNSNGVLYYHDWAGRKWRLLPFTSGEALTAIPGGLALRNLPTGYTFTNPQTGNTYIYDAENNMWYRKGEELR